MLVPFTEQMRKWLGEEAIARFGQMRDEDGFMPPPWRVFPAYPPTTIGWRMGTGEMYWLYWSVIYGDLTKTDRRQYRRTYRAPLHWFWFYWRGDPFILPLLISLLALMTWPFRFFLHHFFIKCSKPAIEIPEVESTS